MKTIHKVQSVIFSCLMIFIFTNECKAQMDEERVGAPFKDTLYPTILNTGLGTSSRDAQGVSATVGTNIRIFPSVNRQTEVHISIDRTTPPYNYLIASANVMLPTGNFDQGYYYSVNGGSTWSGSDTYPGGANDGDPSTAFDADGNAFVSTLQPTPPPSATIPPPPVGFYNIGSYDLTPWLPNPPGPLPTWYTTTPNGGFGDFDKEMIAVDNFPNSPNFNNMYCVGTEFTSQDCVAGTTGNLRFFSSTTASNLGGSAFSNPITDIRGGATGYGWGANVQTGPNGEVFVCWTDYINGLPPASGIGFAFSTTTGGASFPSTNVNIAAFGSNYTGGVNQICDQRFQGTGYLAGDAGASISPSPFGVPLNASCSTGGRIRMMESPSMAVDRGCGKNNHNGRVYIAFPEMDQNTGTAVIAVSYLDPPYNTSTWHTPVIVSPETSFVDPFDNTTFFLTHSFFPWIAVDDITGIVSVVYYCFDGTGPLTTADCSGAGAGHVQPNWTNTYVAYSTNGGTNFNPVLVSTSGHLTLPIIQGSGGITYCGDYIGIDAYDGKAYPTWMDDRTGTGNWQIYVSEIDYNNIPTGTACTTVPNVLDIPPTIISSGTTKVYEAVDNIVVPTTPTYQTNSGSNVTIVAGIEINHTNGFSASNELHSFIAPIQPCACSTDQRLSANNIKGGSPSDMAATPTNLIQKETKLGNNIKLGIFPNPTSGVVYIDLSAQNAGNLIVNLRDVNGKQIVHNVFAANEGANSFKLDLNSLNSGVYFIHITDENGVTIKNDKLVLMGQ